MADITRRQLLLWSQQHKIKTPQHPWQIDIIENKEGLMAQIQNPFISNSLFALTFKKRPLPQIKEEIFIISNNPERIVSGGVIEKIPLKPSTRYQILFHHSFHEDSLLEISLSPLAPQKNEIKLLWNSHFAGPSLDPVYNGQILVERYLESLKNKNAVFLNASGSAPTVLWSQKIKAEESISGMIDVQTLENTPTELTLTSKLITPETTIPRVTANAKETSENETYRSEGWMEKSKISRQLVLHCPGEQKVKLGETPLIHNHQKEIFRGHYGLLQDFEWAILTENPHWPYWIELSFQARGGIAGAVFEWDEEIYSIPPQTAFQTPFIFSKSLWSGEKLAPLFFMAQPGSYYPVELSIKCTAAELNPS